MKEPVTRRRRRKGKRLSLERVYTRLEALGIDEPVLKLQEALELLQLPRTTRSRKEGGGRSSRQPRARPIHSQHGIAIRCFKKGLKPSYREDSRVQQVMSTDLSSRNEKRQQAIAGLVTLRKVG
jgi:hypothetical protein